MKLETQAILPKQRSIKEQIRINISVPRALVGVTSFKSARYLLLLVVALLTTASPVQAENLAGSVTVSPFFGGQGFPFNGETHYDADLNWGLRGGYNFTRNIGTELFVSIMNTVHDPEVTHGTIYQYGADLLYHFRPDKACVPFLAIGFGNFTMNYDHVYPSETSAYFNYGAGVRYALTDWLDLRADFRHAVTLDYGDQAITGTLGVCFKFGGR